MTDTTDTTTPEASPTAEHDALLAATTPQPPSKPKFIVIENKLVVQTEQGELKLPLQLKTKLIRSIRSAGVDEMDQFFLILDSIGAEDALAKLDELDILDTAEIVAKFFAEFQSRQEARLGELSGSQSS